MTVEVVPAGERWEVRVVGVPMGTFRCQADAVDRAEILAERRSMTLRISRGDGGAFQTHKHTTTFG
ncbi:DUF2188 domain-containing protein [Natrarchaeobaculum sulfurireducens]|uniref:DUF2188 domain-containing protein n=1 Tax=Natrarchaeobaculum sulfurireducens TaxID=2044521 RepID=UPI000E3CA493